MLMWSSGNAHRGALLTCQWGITSLTRLSGRGISEEVVVPTVRFLSHWEMSTEKARIVASVNPIAGVACSMHLALHKQQF